MTIQAIVVDDERYSREELVYLLSKFKEIKIVGEADTAETALPLVAKLEPDVVFVDIEMVGMNGLEFANIIKKFQRPPYIVFATAFPDYAVEAFQANAIDYLLKPFDEMRITETVKRIIQQLEPIKPKSPFKLAVQEADRILYIEPASILYIARNHKETIIRTNAGEFTSKHSLKELEEKLSSYHFYRTHKSFLVNVHHICEVSAWNQSTYNIKVTGIPDQVPLSRNYIKELRELLEI